MANFLLKTNNLLIIERLANTLCRQDSHDKISSTALGMGASEDAACSDLHKPSNAGKSKKLHGGISSPPFSKFYFSSKIIYFQRPKAIGYDISAASRAGKLSFSFSTLFSGSARIAHHTKYEVLNFNFQPTIEASAIACMSISEKPVQPIELYILDKEQFFNYQTRSCR